MLWRKMKLNILIHSCGWENNFNSQLQAFLHLPGNQTALSSRDKFHIAIIIVCVCTEGTQTITPSKWVEDI